MSAARDMAWALLSMLVTMWATAAVAQTTAKPEQAQISFTYENPKLQPPRYTLLIQEDGSGRYRSEGGGPPSDVSADMPAEAEDRPIYISKAMREEMFSIARKNKLFARSCSDGGKAIAYQGTKTLAYRGPEGEGSCSYNWSKNPQIDKLTQELQAVAVTLDEGSKLEREYQHSRLSLDQEIEFLQEMVRDGRAAEVGNIAPILEKLANDDAVLQRVQRRARELLQQAKSDGKGNGN